MRLWLVLGQSDWLLRLPSALFAAACVPVFFLLARKIVSEASAAMGATLVALSPPLIYHAQEARSYPLTVLLVMLSWSAATRLLEVPSTRSRLVYILVAAAVVYAHVIGLLFVAGQLLWLVASRRRDAVVAGASIAALITPQLTLTFGPGANGPDWIPPTTADRVAATIRYLAGTGTPWMAFLIVVAWIVGGYVAAKRGDALALVPVGWVLVPFFGLLALSEISPMLLGRYLIMIVPGAVLLVCIIRDALPREGTVVMAIILVVGLPGLHSSLSRDTPDWRIATRVLLDQADEDDAVLFIRSRQLVEHYWSVEGLPVGVPQQLSLPQSWGTVRRQYAIDVPKALSTLTRVRNVWVVDRVKTFALEPGEKRLLTEIERRWTVTGEWSLDGGAIVIRQFHLTE